ncbi:hypothetical protein [Mesorhizobium sp. KR9-304]|uniref:hypothetical protein n=1 Tax=Mesorhizobium sp. KR9-304 TaxID=3156614 RepID=UPI0032B609A7
MKFRFTMGVAAAVFALVALLPVGAVAKAPQKDQVALFAAAAKDGRTGVAHKTKPVDARPAVAGEVVVTVIKSEGVETSSKPAEAGDWVVRNRCPETGNEEYLVSAAKFPARYGDAQSEADASGYRSFVPKGTEMGYFIVPPSEGEFVFTAPWGEAMVARPGDAIVQSPSDPADTYRIAAASFACSYEIVTPPSKP